MRTFTRSLGTIGLVLLVVAAIALSALALRPRDAGSDQASAAQPSTLPSSGSTASSSSTRAASITAAVYGDQVTLGGASTLKAAEKDDRSWISHLSGTGVHVIGGSAQGQGTAEQLSDQAEPVRADVYVAFLGVADAYAGSSAPQSIAQLRTLARKLGVADSPRFVVVALGPARGLNPVELGQWNQALEKAAKDSSWTYADPWRGIRTDSFGWTEKSLEHDRTSPSEEGATRLAKQLAPSIRAAAQAG